MNELPIIHPMNSILFQSQTEDLHAKVLLFSLWNQSTGYKNSEVLCSYVLKEKNF